MKNALLTFLFLLSWSSIILAQEEIYQPVEIRDTTNLKQNNKPEKSKKEIDDAKTALEKRKEKLNNIRVGGNFGLQFGNYTYVNISPTVGYLVLKDRLELGGGPIFIYQRYKYSSLYVINYFIYGVDIYARGFFYKGLYAMAQSDIINKPSYVYANRRVTVPHFLIGAGYAAPMGNIGTFNISALFSCINNSETIYKGTFGNFPLILNMGFSFGLGGK